MSLPDKGAAAHHPGVPGATPILMYHSISASPPRPFRKFAVSPEQFDAQLRFLHENGYATLTVSELVERRARGAQCPARAVVLTFDDGFADFHEGAFPALARYGMRATLYVATGFVGQTSAWLGTTDIGRQLMLTWTQLKQLAHCGIEIGAHSVSHSALDRLPDDEMRSEILASKRVLEDALGIMVTSFAYPFGLYSPRVRDTVEATGYTSACAVRYGLSHIGEDPFALSRHIVHDGIGPRMMDALLRKDNPGLSTYVDRLRSRTWARIRQHFTGHCHG